MKDGKDNLIVLENKNYRTLNVFALGREKCEPMHAYSYENHDFYLIHYVIYGCGTFIKNGKSQKVSMGKMFVIKPGNTYSYYADADNPWEYMWFICNGEIASMAEDLPDVMMVDGEIFMEMLRAKDFKTMRTEYVTGKVYEFFSLMLETGEMRQNYVQMVADFVKINYMRKIHVKDIADSMNLNSRYLSRMFKEAKGVGIKEYILQYKMQKAKGFLAKGMQVSEAARMVGYDDAFTFSKAFKKYIGITPSKVS